MSTPKLTTTRIMLFLLTLGGIILFRYIPESLSNPVFSKSSNVPILIGMHYFLFYLATFFAFTLLLLTITKQNVGKIIDDILKGSFLIILPPLIDLIFFGKNSSTISYFTFSSLELVKTFFTFGLLAEGISLGSKIVGTIIVFAIALYVWNVTKNIIKTVIGSIGSYTIIFLCAGLPNIVLFILPSNSKTIIDRVEQIFSQSWYSQDRIFEMVNLGNKYSAMIWWLAVCLLLFVIGFISRKELMKNWFLNMRWLRLFYYFFLFVISLKLANNLWNFFPALFNILNLLTLCMFLLVSLLGVWIAVIVNDIYDLEIDIISNPERPLAAGKISKEEYVALGVLFSLLMCSGLYLLGGVTALALLLGQVLYFMYSAPPMKFKRNFLLSSIATGLAGTAVVVGGFFLTKPNSGLEDFPFIYAIFFFLVLSLIGNIKDIKDYAGDKKNNIKTIPVVFGQKNGITIISIFYFLTIIVTPFIIQKYYLFIPALLYGALVFFVMKKTPFDEKRVFPFIFVYFILLALFI
jgi:4-hydroxybenzoate polyprenyltransferase